MLKHHVGQHTHSHTPTAGFSTCRTEKRKAGQGRKERKSLKARLGIRIRDGRVAGDRYDHLLLTLTQEDVAFGHQGLTPSLGISWLWAIVVPLKWTCSILCKTMFPHLTVTRTTRGRNVFGFTVLLLLLFRKMQLAPELLICTVKTSF